MWAHDMVGLVPAGSGGEHVMRDGKMCHRCRRRRIKQRASKTVRMTFRIDGVERTHVDLCLRCLEFYGFIDLSSHEAELAL